MIFNFGEIYFDRASITNVVRDMVRLFNLVIGAFEYKIIRAA